MFCRTEHIEETTPTLSASCCCSNQSPMVVDLANPPGDMNPSTSVKHLHQHQQQQRTPTNCLVVCTEQIAEKFQHQRCAAVALLYAPCSSRVVVGTDSVGSCRSASVISTNPVVRLGCDTPSSALSCPWLRAARRRSRHYARGSISSTRASQS